MIDTADLIKALQKARGYDRKLDDAILKTMRPEAIIDEDHRGHFFLPGVREHFDTPHYTGSIDTASGLVPKGWLWNASCHDHDGRPQYVVLLMTMDDPQNIAFGIGETLALAFCIAALQALTP